MSEVVMAVQDLNGEEGAVYFDSEARRIFGISGQDFVDRYDRCEFDSADEDRRVIELEILLPFAENLRNGRRHP